MTNTYEELRFGSIIYLVNCVVTPHELKAGFGFFEANCPTYFPINDGNNIRKIGRFFAPEEIRDSVHAVALGDFSSPIILKRLD